MEMNVIQACGEVPTERYRKLYFMLLDAIPSSVLLIDRDMRILSANRNFLEKSRRSSANTIGRRLEEVFPAIILDHIDFARRIRQVLEKNQPTRGERMTYRAPGIPIRIYYYSIIPFCWQGVVESAILLMEDVTEQVRLSEEVHRVERHLASVVESASDIVLSTDMEGKILTWNAAARKTSGYALEEVRGNYFFQFCAQEHQEEVKRIFSNEGMRQGPEMGEWNLITRQGDPMAVYWVCSLMQEDQSQPTGIVAVGRDLTERRKFEIQLLQSQKLAALGVMAGGIAHEIRNPLAICSSAAQFLREKEVAEAFRQECAEKIIGGIQRASAIIEHLLRFSRPARKMEITQINLLQLIQETVALVTNQAKLQKIEIKLLFPEENVRISGMPTLLQQVFFNLFLNAVQAMPEGGLLSIAVETMKSELLIRIADTGHGISPENMDKIFDPFYTTSVVGKGTGLGLSLCYSIIKQHFGSIEVDSAPGKGSTFTLRLPLR